MGKKTTKPRGFRVPPMRSIVAVHWNDAWIEYGETQADKFRDSAPVTTYGMLLRCTDVVTVACEVMPDGDYRSVTHIPRGMVTKITRLG